MGGNVSAEYNSKASKPSRIVIDPSPTTPDWRCADSATDPHYGFDDRKRKERVMIATPEELESAKVPLEHRDYCAHKFIAFAKCRKDKFPLVYRCAHERHDWEVCQVDDYTIRMKEYERERRLLERKQRKEQAALKAECN